jgi:toxin ParE1/3/4
MARYLLLQAAARRMEDIYLYSLETWGKAQADLYARGLSARFEAIAARRVPWRPIPRDFGIDAFYCRHEHHYIYWRELADGTVGIVTVLHERMHQIDRFRDDLPV